MVEKVIMPGRNIIDFARYQQGRTAALSVRTCRHCGAALLDGEREDECSSVSNTEASDVCAGTRKFRAD